MRIFLYKEIKNLMWMFLTFWDYKFKLYILKKEENTVIWLFPTTVNVLAQKADISGISYFLFLPFFHDILLRKALENKEKMKNNGEKVKERREKMTTLKSQEITNELRDEIKRLRGSAMRRRDKRISDTLKQVHKPYNQRSIKDIESHSGTILFDLT